MAKTLAIILGIVFVVLSLVAFIPNQFIGANNSLFTTDVTYNIMYLIFGIALLIAAGAGEGASALWLKIIGVLELILFIDGLFQSSALFSFIGANMADTWLNLVLGIILVLGGYAKSKGNMGNSQTSPSSNPM